MKTFISDIIPRLQRFSKKLDSTSALTNKNWVLLNDDPTIKVVYIFSEQERLLRIAENGRIKKGKWDYIGNNSMETEIDNQSLLFKLAFLDDHLLALKLDGTEEFALLINEPNYDSYLNTIDKLNSFLEDTYLWQTPRSFEGSQLGTHIEINQDQIFSPEDFPALKYELNALRKILQNYPSNDKVNIVISFAKHHSLKAEWFRTNPKLSYDIVNQKIVLRHLELLFALSKTNYGFQEQLENYIRKELEDE